MNDKDREAFKEADAAICNRWPEFSDTINRNNTFFHDLHEAYALGRQAALAHRDAHLPSVDEVADTICETSINEGLDVAGSPITLRFTRVGATRVATAILARIKGE